MPKPSASAQAPEAARQPSAAELAQLAGQRPVHGPVEPPNRATLLMNFIPLLHILACAACWLWPVSMVCRLFLFGFTLYLLPALVVRAVMAIGGRPQGLLHQDSGGFKRWWFAFQCQTVFNRLPWLEELLRLVPGLYALWIRLWGGRVSPRCYIAPGATLLDRWAVEVQTGAVLGYGCLLVAHLGTRGVDGRGMLLVAAPCVQQDAIVGGLAKLGPGATLLAGQVLPTGRHLGPYATWPKPRPEATSDAQASSAPISQEKATP